MEILIALLSLVAGLIFGFVMGKVTVVKEKPVGILRIDNSDPDDGPYLFLELTPETNPNVLKKRKYVSFEVKVKNFISQE